MPRHPHRVCKFTKCTHAHALVHNNHKEQHRKVTNIFLLNLQMNIQFLQHRLDHCRRRILVFKHRHLGSLWLAQCVELQVIGITLAQNSSIRWRYKHLIQIF